MRKHIAAAALIMTVAPMLVGSPASAHTPDIQIAGFQYFFSMAEVPPEFGTTGYANTPAGAVAVGAPLGTSEGDGLGTISNRDAVPHTFTECTSACDTAAGSSEGASFDVSVGPSASAPLPQLPSGSYTFMCTVHTWMRGALEVD